MSAWLGLAFCASALWGASYALLKLAPSVSPFATTVVVGLLQVAVGGVGAGVVGWQASWGSVVSSWKTVVGVFGYAATTIGAFYCYLLATTAKRLNDRDHGHCGDLHRGHGDHLAARRGMVLGASTVCIGRAGADRGWGCFVGARFRSPAGGRSGARLDATNKSL